MAKPSGARQLSDSSCVSRSSFRASAFQWLNISSAIASPLQQAGQTFVWRNGERVDYGHTAPGEALLEILRQQEIATRFSRCRKNESIPNTQSVVCGQIQCGIHQFARGLMD